MKKYILITIVCLCLGVIIVPIVISNVSKRPATTNSENIVSEVVNEAAASQSSTHEVENTPSDTYKASPIPSPKPAYTVNGETVVFKEGYSITFKSAEYTKKDFLNEEYDVVILTLDYTNNSAETNSYAFSLKDSAFQNGVELEEFNNHELMPSDCNTTKDVRPGSTAEVTLAYKLTEDSDTMEFEIGELYSDEKDRYIVYYNFE